VVILIIALVKCDIPTSDITSIDSTTAIISNTTLPDTNITLPDTNKTLPTTNTTVPYESQFKC
jgi:hypothetical protein